MNENTRCAVKDRECSRQCGNRLRVTERITSDDNEIGTERGQTANPLDFAVLPRRQMNVGQMENPNTRRTWFEHVNRFVPYSEHVAF